MMEVSQNELQNYNMAKQETCQAIVLKEKFKDKEENRVSKKSSFETIVQDVEDNKKEKPHFNSSKKTRSREYEHSILCTRECYNTSISSYLKW